MLLEKIRIDNLYAFDNFEIQLEKFNLILGPNACGKSNFIKVLDLISHIFYSDNELLASSDSKYNELLTNKNKLLNKPTSTIELNFKSSEHDKIEFNNINLSIEIEDNCFSSVILIKDNTVLLDFKYEVLEVSNCYSITIGGTMKNKDAVKDRLLVDKLNQKFVLHVLLNLNLEDSELYITTKAIAEHFFNNNSLTKYNNYSNITEMEIRKFYAVESNQDLLRKELEKINLHVTSFENVEYKRRHENFDNVNYNYKTVEVLNSLCINDVNLNFYNLSGGTVKLMRNLYENSFLHTNSLLFKDEFENEFHEYLALKELERLKYSNHQVILTTHLTSLMEPSILKKKEVILFNIENGITRAKKLSDISELREDGRHSWVNWYRTNRLYGYPNYE